MSNLTTNNTSLQEILAKVNALPEAGSGSGGGVETCTVTIAASAYPTIVLYVDPKTNNFVDWRADEPGDNPGSIETVNNSLVYIDTGSNIPNISGGVYAGIGNLYFVNPGAGGTCTIG